MTTTDARPWTQEELRRLHARKTEKTSCKTCAGRGVFTVPVDDYRSDISHRYYPCFGCDVFAQRTPNEKAARYVELIRMAEALAESGWIFVRESSGEVRGHKDKTSPGRKLNEVLAQIRFKGREDLIEEAAHTRTAYGARLERYIFNQKD